SRTSYTMRMARSRTSGENLGGLLIRAPFSQKGDPPRKPGRFSHHCRQRGNPAYPWRKEFPTLAFPEEPQAKKHKMRAYNHQRSATKRLNENSRDVIGTQLATSPDLYKEKYNRKDETQTEKEDCSEYSLQPLKESNKAMQNTGT
ncbi:MAG: hypothetical protein PHI49_09460, partial [Halothiobacillaceae bacterium]|nr:hypothetical protein [Halothiobacillaceae bacterium]